MVDDKNYNYDVALSFAGEDRAYVKKVAEILFEIGIRVFYDEYEQVNLWGKNLFTHLDDIYREKAKYCVLFISKHYKEKLWPNHERESAQARAFESNKEYILPVRFDNTEIAGIRPTVGFIKADNLSPEELAYIIASKVVPELDIKFMVQFLQDWLPDYEISVKGTKVMFKNDIEDFYAEYPLRLMVEMYRIGELERMFLMPAIVPW